jgi:hypothetical protein
LQEEAGRHRDVRHRRVIDVDRVTLALSELRAHAAKF